MYIDLKLLRYKLETVYVRQLFRNYLYKELKEDQRFIIQSIMVSLKVECKLYVRFVLTVLGEKFLTLEFIFSDNVSGDIPVFGNFFLEYLKKTPKMYRFSMSQFIRL